MLIDTSGLLCYFDESDIRYSDAVEFFKAAPARLTQSYVLAEFIALCQSRGLNRIRVLDFSADLLDNPHVEVVWVDETLHRSALTLLQERLDKTLGLSSLRIETYTLCDAVSFVLMRERGFTEALTTDHHFEQEGFTRLLQP